MTYCDDDCFDDVDEVHICIHVLRRWLLWRWSGLVWQSDVALFGKVTWVMHYVCICMMFHLEVTFICISMTMAWKLWQTRRPCFAKWRGASAHMPYLAFIMTRVFPYWYHMHISGVGLICIDIYISWFMTMTCDDVYDVEWCDDVCASCLWWWFVMMMYEDEWNNKWDNEV